MMSRGTHRIVWQKMPNYLIRLLRTGCACGNMDRGVLRCGNSRMGFRDSSNEFGLNGLISSQGTPVKTIRVSSKFAQFFCQGWWKSLATLNQGLDVRRKRHKTEGSSIQSFDFVTFLAPAIVRTSVILLAIFAFQAGAGEVRSSAKKSADPVESVADDFEGMMLHFLYNQMVQGQKIVEQGDNNPFAPSNGELIYKSMQEQVMMQQLAKRRPLGFGSLVARQLRNQAGVGDRILIDSGRQSGPTTQKGDR